MWAGLELRAGSAHSSLVGLDWDSLAEANVQLTVVLRGEREVSLHAWVSSGLSLAPLRLIFQAAAEEEAEDEEGAVTLGSHRRSAAAAAAGKALQSSPGTSQTIPARLVPPAGFPWCPC